eukprot:TRINITY_DN21526_c0_g1_i5.p1 TRINITY_DN21526_c0_g1~~TRINITY_DN21526_c0_g1_i5.p1  ORF type:complete len:453 (-),score=24.59 TRINITY_DN21526_c0_g1_i5:401-1759(-)
MLVLAGVLRLGFVATFISEPVLVGFKAAVGLVIVVDQLPHLLGIHIEKTGFFRNVIKILEALPHTSLPTLGIGIGIVATLVLLERFAPKVPAPLIAVALSIVVMASFRLDEHGVETVGNIPRAFPPFTLPDFSLALQLWPAAAGVALMSFTETIAAGRAFANNEEPLVLANRELLATGFSNAASAFLGAMPSGGGTTQTAVNRLAGAVTQLAELVTATAALVTMLLLAPLISWMPQAALAGVVIVYSLGLIKPAEFKSILFVRRKEFWWALAAFAGVVLLGTLKGIVLAIAFSLTTLACDVMSPPIYILGRLRNTNIFRPCYENPEDMETFPGMLMIRLEGRVFFANAQHIGDQLRPLIAAERPKILVLDMHAVPDLEYTALNMLIQFERKNREQGVTMWLVGVNATVSAMLRQSSLWATLGDERILPNLEVAVQQYQEWSAVSEVTPRGSA